MAADTPKASPRKSSRSTASKASATPVENPVASPRKTAAAAKAETTPAPAAPRARSSGKKPSAADREQMIAVRAYYLAEERGFAGGDCVADWLAAEEWVDGQFPKGKAAVS
ncbi:DUF2934 domain-containing protein [Acidithiobacillus sp.]